MVVEDGSHDWQSRRVREWLLLLLRFAITREHLDLSGALSQADELDSLGVCWRPTAPTFFRRTTNEVCEAIIASGNAQNQVLQRHLARIDNARLRRAFEGALGSRPSKLRDNAVKTTARRKPDLWKDLPSR
jgi:hypothetical protein